MSRIKSDAEQKSRTMLNTTIKTDVLREFKDYCKELGYPMNLILDCFMEQFKNGEFNLRIGKNNKLEVDIDE